MVNRKSSNRKLLYHLLPVVFWLLAIGGIVFWEIINYQLSIFNYIPAILALISTIIIRHVPRHADSIAQCFQVALLLGIASYWLPSVLFLMIPIWGYLIYQRLFNLRAFSASLIGFACIAIWIGVLSFCQLSTLNYHLSTNLSAWIPTGSLLIAYIASTTARRILRVR
jgi:hypothetical protein